MPTVLDAAGVEAPEALDGVAQQPIDGASLLPRARRSPRAPAPRRTQYFEMLGSRAIYHDGWKATTDHVGPQLSVERRARPRQPRLRPATTGRCSTSSRTSPRRTTSATQHPERLRGTDRAVVGRGRAQQRAAGDGLVPRPRHRARAVAVGAALARGAAPGRRAGLRRCAAAARRRLPAAGGGRGRRRALRACSAPSATGATAGRATCSTAGR